MMLNSQTILMESVELQKVRPDRRKSIDKARNKSLPNSVQDDTIPHLSLVRNFFKPLDSGSIKQLIRLGNELF